MGDINPPASHTLSQSRKLSLETHGPCSAPIRKSPGLEDVLRGRLGWRLFWVVWSDSKLQHVGDFNLRPLHTPYGNYGNCFWLYLSLGKWAFGGLFWGLNRLGVAGILRPLERLSFRFTFHWDLTRFGSRSRNPGGLTFYTRSRRPCFVVRAIVVLGNLALVY